jgi:hypothetical protein
MLDAVVLDSGRNRADVGRARRFADVSRRRRRARQTLGAE